MKSRRALLLSITVVLALCAACGVWLHRERQQYALNRQLIAALERAAQSKRPSPYSCVPSIARTNCSSCLS